MKQLIKLIEEKILKEKMTLKQSIKYILELKEEIKEKDELQEAYNMAMKEINRLRENEI